MRVSQFSTSQIWCLASENGAKLTIARGHASATNAAGRLSPFPSAVQILQEYILLAESKWHPGPQWPGNLGNVVVSFPALALWDGGRAQKKVKMDQ